jgi:hypothetical protein
MLLVCSEVITITAHFCNATNSISIVIHECDHLRQWIFQDNRIRIHYKGVLCFCVAQSKVQAATMTDILGKLIDDSIPINQTFYLLSAFDYIAVVDYD